MKVAIFLRVEAPSQQMVSQAVLEGCKRAGEDAYQFTVLDGPLREDADCVVLFGIGGDAKLIYDLNREAGKRTVLLDKPYARGSKSPGPRYSVMRIAVDGFQPLRYFQKIKRPAGRWDRLRLKVRPYRNRRGDAILFDGASHKYIAWNELGNGQGTGLEQWAEWGQRMVDRIQEYSDRPVIYRARPSHNPAPDIKGCHVSRGSLEEDFEAACLIVSHGGNIGFDAALEGIPHFAIGNSIARPLSETEWEHVGNPHRPGEAQRRQWLWDLAYCQWDLEEFRDGQAWRYVRETMEIIDSLQIDSPQS